MKVKTITVGAAMKLSRNYSTTDGNVSLTAELDEGDNYQEIHDELSKAVSSLLSKDIARGLKTLQQLG